MRWIAAIVLATVVVAAGAAGWLAYEWHIPYQGHSGKAAVVDVPRGATTRAIAGQLQWSGVVRSAMAFEIWCRLHHSEKLEAGEYRFDRAMTAPEVFEMLAAGRVWTVSVTIPEGWTMFDIAGAVAQAGLASRVAFLRVARDPSPIRDLAPDVPTLEGFLFPATYRFPHRTTAQAVVNAMVGRFREAWTNVTRDDPPSRNLTLEQVVTLASLVQQETPEPKERPVIASVFLNRLRLGFPLECDPTVIYALKLAGRHDGNLRPTDLRVRSPYNTYLRYGLPPGPIANPGVASLKAVLDPAHTGYLYFVADGSGGHAFSRTLSEHLRNVARYRHWIATEKEEIQSRGHQPPAVPRLHNHAGGSMR